MEEQGLSESVAADRATMYQMKVTREGLLNGYKVSREVMHKYDTETGEQVDRYARTFNPDTGEIQGEGLPEHVEDRLFEPAMMGSSGDSFSCIGDNGYANPGHVDGAIRCKQYFVHSSLAGVNGSIYHSSTYAAMTDAEWQEMRSEAVKVKLESKAQVDKEVAELNAL